MRFQSCLPIAAVLAFCAPVAANAATVTTPLNSINGLAGIMFDITTGADALNIESLATIIDPGQGSFEFYTRSGTVVGNTNSSVGWTLRDTFNVSQPVQGLVSFDLADFTVAANSTYGFYFTSTAFQNVRYGNGTAVGDVIGSDANLAIRSGYGKNYAFGFQTSPRNFSGSITYSVPPPPPPPPPVFGAVPEPATWAMMIIGFGAVGSAMRRRKPTTARVSFA